MQSKEKIFVVNNQVVLPGSKINWPDLNYPGSGDTILRIVFDINYKDNEICLDSETGPIFGVKNFPEGVGFFKKC